MRHLIDYEKDKYSLLCNFKELNLLKDLLEDRVLKESDLRYIQIGVHLLDKIEDEIERVKKNEKKKHEHKHDKDKKPFDPKHPEVQFPDVLDPDFAYTPEDEDEEDDECGCFDGF